MIGTKRYAPELTIEDKQEIINFSVNSFRELDRAVYSHAIVFPVAERYGNNKQNFDLPLLSLNFTNLTNLFFTNVDEVSLNSAAPEYRVSNQQTSRTEPRNIKVTRKDGFLSVFGSVVDEAKRRASGETSMRSFIKRKVGYMATFGYKYSPYNVTELSVSRSDEAPVVDLPDVLYLDLLKISKQVKNTAEKHIRIQEKWASQRP